jgi:hypothetical protein
MKTQTPTNDKFKRLKPGDTVTINRPLKAYGYAFPTFSGVAYVPSGQTGTVAKISVPFVSGRNGTFICIDFPHDTPLLAGNMKPVLGWSGDKHGNLIRVAAVAGDIAT